MERKPENATMLEMAAEGETGANEDSKPSRKPLNMNGYTTRKTAVQGMMDIALLVANANQLKNVLSSGTDQRFHGVTICMISMSMILQIAVGIVLIFISVWNINDPRNQRRANTANTIVGVMILFIIVVNVLIIVFGPGDLSSSDRRH